MSNRSRCLAACLAALAASPVAAQEERRPGRAERMRQQMTRDDGAPKVGEQAPPLKLKSLDGKKTVELSGFRGKKPVLLFFGSYT